MALPIETQAKYWGIAAAVFLAVLWLLGDMLLPFVVGAALAYFLDPVVGRLTRLGLSRLAATFVVSLIALAVLVLALLLIVPALVAQGMQLAAAAPELLAQLRETLLARFPAIIGVEDAMRDNLGRIGEALREQAPGLAGWLAESARGAINLVIFVVIAPVAGVYLLADWPRLIARLDDLLPREHAPTIRRLAGEIDAAIAGFVRGQVTVCLILAVYYATALGLTGLQFGLVIGVVAGLISFVPYIGAIIGGVLAIGLALVQFWGDPLMIGIVVAIFVAGQVLEGNILVPNLVGRSVGLHPVWLLLALSVFGGLFGFVGLLVAVPLAAALGVLARFAAERYRESRLYAGDDGAGG